MVALTTTGAYEYRKADYIVSRARLTHAESLARETTDYSSSSSLVPRLSLIVLQVTKAAGDKGWMHAYTVKTNG